MAALATPRASRSPSPRPAPTSSPPPPPPPRPPRRRPAGPVASLSSSPRSSASLPSLLDVDPPSRASPRSQGSIGLFAIKAMTCVDIGTHDEHIQGGNCNTCVGNLADYLMNNGM